MKLKGLVPFAAAGAVITLLAGCSPSPGTAAQVEDRRISTASLDETIESCVDAGQQQWATLPKQDILSFWILAEASQVIADARELGITEQDAAEVFQQQEGSEQFADYDACAAFQRNSAFLSLVLYEIGDSDFLTDLQTLDIEVNPRFGQWTVDLQNPEGPVGFRGPGSLSVPSPIE